MLEQNKQSLKADIQTAIANAEKLAEELNGKAYSLTELPSYDKGFD